MQRGQTLAFIVDPFVEVARHQLAAVQRHGTLGLAGAHQLLKTDRVAAQSAGCGAHAHAVGQHHGRARHTGRFQHALQCRQHLTQAVAPHRQRHAGPQQFNQFFARVGAVRRQRQPRQQRGHGAGRKAVAPLDAVKHLHRAQEAHLPARFCSG